MKNNQNIIQSSVDDELFEYEITQIGINLKGKFSKFNGKGLNLTKLDDIDLPVQLDNFPIAQNIEQVKISVPKTSNFESIGKLSPTVDTVKVSVPKANNFESIEKLSPIVDTVKVSVPKASNFESIEKLSPIVDKVKVPVPNIIPINENTINTLKYSLKIELK